MASGKRKTSMDEIEDAALRGEDTTAHFRPVGRRGPLPVVRRTGKGGRGIQKVNVDFSIEILGYLDEVAELLNVSRQAVIKSYVLQGLDQHHLAQGAVRSRKKRAV